MVDSGGGLIFFETPPTNLLGNIKNIVSHKTVLDNFTVNAISAQKQTIDY
jgi:hypothetical protein